MKADIAESAVVTELLKHGFTVLKPYGDRLPYDVAITDGKKLIRIQVKSAWLSKGCNRYVIDVRQTKTNRKRMLRKYYDGNDFDFAIVYIQDLNDFFVLPIGIFRKYKSTLTLAEMKGVKMTFNRMSVRKYLNRWDLFNGLTNQ